jgi:hypothetical protein
MLAVFCHGTRNELFAPAAGAATLERRNKQANCQSADFETEVSLNSENEMATLESFMALAHFMPDKCIAFFWQ